MYDHVMAYVRSSDVLVHERIRDDLIVEKIVINAFEQLENAVRSGDKVVVDDL
jgi:hypothetical protein